MKGNHAGEWEETQSESKMFSGEVPKSNVFCRHNVTRNQTEI